ncbi:MAG: TonB-dependent receptor [Aquabacterium sp.]|nr:TonB-dependent receptor [Aquabacterium sp.]
MYFLNSVRHAPGLRSALAWACGVALSVGQTAWADEDVVEPLVVTATRTPQALSKVLANVSIVDRVTIERHAGAAVADVLLGLPGIEVSRAGGPAATTQVFLRGADKRHTLVLIDGVPFDSQSTGGASWEALPLQMVDHIEVLRGPASAVYGSDAVAGVIQIFTRKGVGAPQMSVAVGVGDLGLFDTQFSVMGSQSVFDYAVSVGGTRYDGFNARTNTTPGTRAADRDGHAANNYQAQMGWQIDAQHQLRFGTIYQHINGQYDAASSSSKDDQAIKDMSSSHLTWTAQWLPNWLSTTTLGQSLDAYETRPSAYKTHTRVQTASWVNQITQGEHTFRSTLERRGGCLINSTLPLSGTPGVGSRFDAGLGLGYEWHHDALSMAVSAREDHDSEYGEHVTGSLAGGLALSRQWRVRASWGTAYKTPTLYQRFSDSGNPTLKAEASRQGEVGLQFHDQSREFGLTVYDNHVADLISYAAPGICPSSAGCYRNTATAELKGLTLQGAVTVSGVRASGSVDIDTPKDLDSGRILSRRARRHASARLSTDGLGWLWGVQAQAYSKRLEYQSATGPMTPLSAYVLWGVDASKDIDASWKVMLRLDNATDVRYQTANNYASAPRSVFVSVRWTPKL